MWFLSRTTKFRFCHHLFFFCFLFVIISFLRCPDVCGDNSWATTAFDFNRLCRKLVCSSELKFLSSRWWVSSLCSTSFTFVTESSCMISHTRRTSLCRWQCCGFLLRFSTLRRYMLDILSALSLSLCADALLCGAIVVVLYCFLWLCIVVSVCCCISCARSLFAKDWRLILCSGVGILLPGGVTCSELSLTFYCNLCAGKSSINNNPICY